MGSSSGRPTHPDRLCSAQSTPPRDHDATAAYSTRSSSTQPKSSTEQYDTRRYATHRQAVRLRVHPRVVQLPQLHVGEVGQAGGCHTQAPAAVPARDGEWEISQG